MAEKTEEKTETAAQQAPETGEGSPAGPRWFVSCRYPKLTVTCRPAVDKTPTTPPVKGLYAIFRSGVKPNDLRGDGARERGREHMPDRNNSIHWGIFSVIDPGPEPEGGYKSDPISVPRHKRRNAEQKREDRMVIDHLRSIALYNETAQNNHVEAETVLVELNWDPTPHSGSAQSVNRGRPSIGQNGVNDEAETAAPVETRAATPAARAPSLSGKK